MSLVHTIHVILKSNTVAFGRSCPGTYGVSFTFSTISSLEKHCLLQLRRHILAIENNRFIYMIIFSSETTII